MTRPPLVLATGSWAFPSRRRRRPGRASRDRSRARGGERGSEDLDRPIRGVRGLPSDGAHRACGEGSDRCDETRGASSRRGGSRRAPRSSTCLWANARLSGGVRVGNRRVPARPPPRPAHGTGDRREAGGSTSPRSSSGRGRQARQGSRPGGVPEADRVGEAGLPAEGLRQPDRQHRPQRGQPPGGRRMEPGPHLRLARVRPGRCRSRRR